MKISDSPEVLFFCFLFIFTCTLLGKCGGKKKVENEKKKVKQIPATIICLEQLWKVNLDPEDVSVTS